MFADVAIGIAFSRTTFAFIDSLSFGTQLCLCFARRRVGTFVRTIYAQCNLLGSESIGHYQSKSLSSSNAIE